MLRAVLFVALALAAVAHAATPRIVQTTGGLVQGTTETLADVFRGIPYGATTEGSARWTSPVPPPSWAPATLPVTVDGPGCPQHCFGPSWMCPPVTSENCLTLNVFAPLGGIPAVGEENAKPLPVMVWLPGGNFFQGYGGGLLYDGSLFVNRSRVVLVAVTYRLGALGFLYSPASGFSGMLGIEDQRLALRWVQDNIANFGGDKTRVTLFGQSAGAGSVGIHLQSSESSPLFHQAIMQSNMLTIPLREPDEALPLSNAFAKLLNCTLTDLVCMRGKSMEELVVAEDQTRKMIELDLKRPLQAFMPWTPVVGAGQPIPGQPMDYLRAPNFRKPLIIGTVSEETTIFIYEAFGKPMNQLAFDVAVTLICKLENLKKISDFYKPQPNVDLRPLTATVGTHYIFNCPNRNITRVLSTKMPTWFYYFDHVMSFSKQGWGPNFTFCDDKVCHGSEIPFVFNSYSLGNFTGTADEVVLAQSMVDYWTNFAKTGDPNQGDLSDGSISSKSKLVTWPAYTPTNDISLHLATPASYTETGNLNERCTFWDNIGYDLP